MPDVEIDPLTPAPPPGPQPPSTSSSDAPPPYRKQHHRKPLPKRMPLDAIDVMDGSIPPNLLRHHSGPFDAVTKSMFLSQNQNPLVALEHSTQEALEATPEISIQDSLERHVPLQNTAIVEPGQRPYGNDKPVEYEEENLLGDVGRWQGIEYDDDDRKAHGHAHSDGAFVNLGPNQTQQDVNDHPKRKAVPGLFPNSADPDSIIEMLPPERDLRVEGMQASGRAVQEAKMDKGKHLGIVEGIKRRLSGRKSKHQEKEP